jgi:hypothetical protein
MKCDVDKHPEPLQCDGFTEWKRGTGPHSPEALKNIQEGLRKACLGVPKKESTKQKMRQAKLGKRKSPETRQRMSASHQNRIRQKESIGISQNAY